MEQQQNENSYADAQSRAVSEANGENLTAGLGGKTYFVWSADYYDSRSQIFPHEHQKHGKWVAADEDDLKKQLQNSGLDVSECRWEMLLPNAE